MTKEEMFQALPVMISSDALIYFSIKTDSCESYVEAIKILHRWYNSEEKPARILTA